MPRTLPAPLANNPKPVAAADADDRWRSAGCNLVTFWYYLLWAGAFFLLIFGCGAHMGHGHHHGGHDQDEGLGSVGPLLPPEKAADPVCGMTVQTAAAKSSTYQGQVYYFCSQNCREKFETAPASYAKAATAASDEKEQHHGCC